jgi:hypothetical protein
MRRTGPEPADAYGHPTGGTYTLGVGPAVADAHDPSTHGLPGYRSLQEARARLVRVLATTFRCSQISLQPTAQPGHRLARGGRGSQAPSCGAAGTPDWPEGPTAQLGHQTGPRGEGGRGGPGNAALHPTAQPGHRTGARGPTAQPVHRTGPRGEGEDEEEKCRGDKKEKCKR